MKKTFRFLALALMATALTFTACSKDDDEENTPNTNKEQEQEQEQEQNPDDPTPNAVIVFKGDTTLLYALDGYSHMERVEDTVYAVLDACGYKRYSADSASYVYPPEITVKTKYYEDTVKNFTISYCILYSNYDHMAALKAAGAGEYDWQMFSNGLREGSSYNISDLDLNSMTLTLTLHCIMFDRYEQIINGVNVSGDGYEGEELLAYFQNFSLNLIQ